MRSSGFWHGPSIGERPALERKFVILSAGKYYREFQSIDQLSLTCSLSSIADRGGVSNAKKVGKSYLTARTICDQVGRVAGNQVWLDSMYST